MLNQVVWSIVPCEGALCSWMYGTDFYLLCLPCFCTMGGGGGGTMPLFSTMVATPNSSLMHLLKS